MKQSYILLAMMAGLFCSVVSPVQAEPSGTTVSEKVSKKAKKGKKAKKQKTEATEEVPEKESVVGTMLRKNTYFNNKEPNFNAEYFIFLQSASWCGPCNQEMPHVAEAYEQMRASGKVELILVSNDQTEAAAQAWLDKYKAKFPAIMPGATLPQCPPARGIPNATIMNANGDVIESGHGSIIRGWKKQTIGEFAVIGDDGESRVAPALKEMKFTNGRPNTKAKYYIYLYSPAPDSLDADFLTSIAGEYKEMKKNKMEIIFISDTKTPALLTKALKGYKAKFPAISRTAAGVSDLPGIGEMGSTPQAWVVTQSGAGVTSGNPDKIVSSWLKIVEANK